MKPIDTAALRVEAADILKIRAHAVLDAIGRAACDFIERRLPGVLRLVDALQIDAQKAAGELMISLDEMPPGSTFRRVVSANAILRGQRDEARKIAGENSSACDEMKLERDAALRELGQLQADYNALAITVLGEVESVPHNANVIREVQRMHEIVTLAIGWNGTGVGRDAESAELALARACDEWSGLHG